MGLTHVYFWPTTVCVCVCVCSVNQRCVHGPNVHVSSLKCQRLGVREGMWRWAAGMCLVRLISSFLKVVVVVVVVVVVEVTAGAAAIIIAILIMIIIRYSIVYILIYFL